MRAGSLLISCKERLSRCLLNKHYQYTLTSTAVATFCFVLVLWSFPTIKSFGQLPQVIPSSHDPAANTFSPFGYHDFTTPAAQDSYLHLLVPATSSNKHHCRLLLSLTALNYPSPVFINWGDEENPHADVQNLAKIHGIVKYLKKFPVERDQDIVLIVDGYDIWFQLRPDVLIKRYYEIILAANERLASKFGLEAMAEHVIYQSVIFGPDKICWPEDVTRPACWAVPDSTLSRWAFGPETDSRKWRHHNRPRWLNSGTIVGPLAHVRQICEASLARVDASSHKPDNNDPISDQFHLANLWGDQEYRRTLVADGPLNNTYMKVWNSTNWSGDGYEVEVELQLPEIKPDQTTEYHITIDYESQLFQPMSYYLSYLGWDISDGSSLNTSQVPSDYTSGNAYEFDLPEDILSSPPPFLSIAHVNSSQEAGHPESELLSGLSWRDISLGANIITKQRFALIHFTAPKEYRDMWWTRMWYYPYGEAIMEGALLVDNAPYLTTPDGRTWWKYRGEDFDDIVPAARVGGGWDDRNGWHSWRKLCSVHEGAVFRNELEPEDLAPPPAEELQPPPTPPPTLPEELQPPLHPASPEEPQLQPPPPLSPAQLP